MNNQNIEAIARLLSSVGICPQLYESQTDDPVNHPPHYTQCEIECIDAMAILFGKEAVATFCKLNAFKYKYRAPFKGSQEEDLKKADWYLKKAKELENAD